MQPDCGDIRCVNDANDEIDCKVLYCGSTTNSSIWFNVTLPASESKDYQIYYDNPDAVNPTDYNYSHWTLEGDDFDQHTTGAFPDRWNYWFSPTGVTVVDDEWFKSWSMSANKSLEIIDNDAGEYDAYLEHSAVTKGFAQLWFNFSSTAGEGVFVIAGMWGTTWNNGGPYFSYDTVTRALTASGTLIDYIALNEPYYLEFSWDSDTDKYNYTIYNSTWSASASDVAYNWVGPEIKYFWLDSGSGSQGTFYFDDVIIRTGVRFPEPSLSVGSEETFVAPKILRVKLTGEFDYLTEEDIKIRIAALVKDKYTDEPVSDANVTIDIYKKRRYGIPLISKNITEKIEGTGIYVWVSGKKIIDAPTRWSKGVYLAHVKASYGSGPVATDIIEFHIDPPSTGTNFYSLLLLPVIIFVLMYAIKNKKKLLK